MKVTLKEIADRANVSISSVSRALSRNEAAAPVHEQTRLRILKIAQELGYHKGAPSSGADGKLPVKRVGLVLNDVKHKYQDPYFSEIIYGIERELMEQGMFLDFTVEVQDALRSSPFPEMDKRHLGVICIGPLKPAFLQVLSKQVPRLLSVGGLRVPGIDCVTVDFRGAAAEAVRYLLRLGHRNVAFIGGSSVVGAAFDEEERCIGYQDALRDARIDPVPERIRDGGFTMAGAHEAMTDLLRADERPTAVFVASDSMAYGAYKAIQESGLSVPGDVSLVSFDDIEMSSFVTPGLTTVRVHKEEMGRIAVKQLMQRMDGSIRLPLTVYLPTELMIRGSCRPLHDHA